MTAPTNQTPAPPTTEQILAEVKQAYQQVGDNWDKFAHAPGPINRTVMQTLGQLAQLSERLITENAQLKNPAPTAPPVNPVQ